MDENQVGKKRRARRTGKEVQRLVEEFISGGMRRSEFCRTRGLSPGTLRRHLEGGKQEARRTPRLVAVELVPAALGLLTGINPSTKQKIKIPAKTVIKFRVFKVAKDAIRGVKD